MHNWTGFKYHFLKKEFCLAFKYTQIIFQCLDENRVVLFHALCVLDYCDE